MEINILLLPLLGGYLFIKNSYYFGYRTIRYNNQELLLHSAAAGLCSLIPSYIVVVAVSNFFPVFSIEWQHAFIFSYSGTAITSLALSVTALVIERFYHDEESEIIKIIYEDNDAIELIFLKALQEEKLISLTLKNNKVYVGFIQQTFFTPYQNLKSIKIIPIISGYRNKKDRGIVFTTIYDHIIQYVDNNEEVNLDVNDFQMGLPLSQINSVNIFDFRVYELFKSSDPNQMSFEF